MAPLILEHLLGPSAAAAARLEESDDGPDNEFTASAAAALKAAHKALGGASTAAAQARPRGGDAFDSAVSDTASGTPRTPRTPRGGASSRAAAPQGSVGSARHSAATAAAAAGADKADASTTRWRDTVGPGRPLRVQKRPVVLAFSRLGKPDNTAASAAATQRSQDMEFGAAQADEAAATAAGSAIGSGDQIIKPTVMKVRAAASRCCCGALLGLSCYGRAFVYFARP
jgi:hypothetical protein